MTWEALRASCISRSNHTIVHIPVLVNYMTAQKVGKRNTREQTDMSQRTRSRASSANTDADGDNGGATVATAEAPEREPRESRDRDVKNEGFHNLADLKEMSISKLTQIAKSMDVPGATGMRK